MVKLNKKRILGIVYVLLILLLLYTPIFFVMIFSFTGSTVMGEFGEFTFGVYGKLFKNAELGGAVLNTLLLSSSAAILATLLGTIAAIGIFYSKRKFRAVLGTANQIPVLNAEIVTAVSLSLMFVYLSIPKGFGTLLIAHLTFCTPFVVLSVIPKLKQLDPNIYEAALDLGATPFKAMYKVIVPQIVPGMITGFLLALTLSIDDFVITVFNTSGFTTLSKYIYDDAVKGGLGVELRALSTIIFVVVFTLLLVMSLRSSKKSKQTTGKTNPLLVR